MNTTQRALQFCCQGQALVGVVDVPERPLPRGLLVLSGGAHCRTGSHRQSALMARLLAPRGIPVMRFDCRGDGDSEGQAGGPDTLADDLRAALHEFSLQLPEMKEVVLWGLGDAAAAAALYAHRDARVRGLILLNPWAGGGAGAEPALLMQVTARFGEIGFWKKVGNPRALALDAATPLPQRLIASLASFDGAALLVVGGEDHTGRQFAELMQRHDRPCRRVTIAGANHTFASRAWRDEVAELSANWIVSW